MLFKNKKHTAAALMTTCTILSLASGAFAIEGHIDGNRCVFTAAASNVQGGKNSRQCRDTDVSCNHAAGTCALHTSTPRVKNNASVTSAAKVRKPNHGKPPEKVEGSVTYVAPEVVAIEEPD